MALIKCPDCGRDVSDLAPACLGCGRPIAGAGLQTQQVQPAAATATTNTPPRTRTGVLRSNLGTPEAEMIAPAEQRRGFPVAAILVGLLVLIVVVASLLIFTGGRPSTPPAASGTASSSNSASTPRPTVTSVPVVAANGGASSAAPASLPDVNGVPCDTLESTQFHIHVHLAIFVDGQEQLVPFGVGIGQPWQVEDSAEGPFVTNGSCFYWIHTHTQDGVVHIESPTRRQFTLGDFFAIWQVPLSPTQLGPAQGPVIAYVNGARDDTNPSDIPLLQHERIQLNIGGDVPPYIFTFPPGD